MVPQCSGNCNVESGACRSIVQAPTLQSSDIYPASEGEHMRAVQPATTVSAPAWRASLGAYVNLMKPHVTVLLLGTTLAAMVVAAGGMPAPWLPVATLLGGALAAAPPHPPTLYWVPHTHQCMTPS